MCECWGGVGGGGGGEKGAEGNRKTHTSEWVSGLGVVGGGCVM